jgi:quinohemoprotein ethanol dehydrogenase
MRRSVLRLAAYLLIGVLLLPATGVAQNASDLAKPPGQQWLTYGGNLANQRYSTLDKLTPANVGQLNGQWVTHLGSGIGSKYSFEATPLVQNGVMYVPTGNDDIYALDARTGSEIWEYHSGLDQGITTVCCGWDNRGLAIGEGLIFSGRLDGSFVAIDQQSGREEWRTQNWQMAGGPHHHGRASVFRRDDLYRHLGW